MSGGYFNYANHGLRSMKEELDAIVARNDDKYHEETLEHFVCASCLLELCDLYMHRIDWLLSGDDDEDSFHERLHLDLMSYDQEYEEE